MAVEEKQETSEQDNVDPDDKAGTLIHDKKDDTSQEEGSGDEAAESKTEKDGEPEEGKGDGKADSSQDGAPDAYEDFEVPEGVELVPEQVEEFKGLVKDLDLTQENAQKLVDYHTASMSKAAEQQSEAWSDLQDKWIDSSKSDKEFGGQEFDSNISIAKKALDQFGTDEFKEALDATGTGNHPEMLRFLYRVGKAIADDKLHFGSSGADSAKSAAEVLFPNQN